MNDPRPEPVRLPFGEGTVPVIPPREATLRVPAEQFPDPIRDLPAAMDRALAEPIGCGALETMIPPRGPIAVLAGDATRGRTTVPVLAALLGRLARLGAGPGRVTIILAAGMHRRLGAGELEGHFGEIAREYPILQHEPGDPSRLVRRGTTAAGTPCSFLKEAAEAALVIGVGAVTFHYFAGFGGGRKLVLPGIAGEETILANHRLSLGPGPEHRSLAPGCAPGSLDSNPVHEDMLEGARLLGPPLFMISVVAGAGGAPALVAAGEIDASHRKGAEFLAAGYAIPLERRFRTVIASAGGAPHDVNLLQTHKAIRHASRAVADGGLLLLAAACPEGIGSPSLRESFARGREAVPAEAGLRYTVNTQAAVSIWEMTGRIRIALRTGIDAGELRRFGFEPWDPAGTAALIRGEGAGEVLVLHDASRFLPVDPV